MSASPKGPGGALWLGPLRQMRRDPLAFFTRLRERYGPIARFRLGARQVFLVSDPEGVKEVLVTHERAFEKGIVLKLAKALLGEGLLTSEGDHHLRQRRLAQPAFHKERIRAYAKVMVDEAVIARDGLADGQAVDLAAEMMRLTLAIVAKTLFGSDVTERAPKVAKAMELAMPLFDYATLPFAKQLLRLPIPPTLRFRRARASLFETVDAIIAERRAAPSDQGDLLSMLLLARDEDGSAMSDLQIRDEVLTLLLAGHETTANALSWAHYLLALHPSAEARLFDELLRTLGTSPPSAEHYGQLPWARAVIEETMRLYPPAWILGRRAVKEVSVLGQPIPVGAVVIVSPYVVQRDPAHYPNPEAFLPDRWLTAEAAERPRFSFFPFGGGSRQCIGEGFARMEMVLVLAAFAQRWRFRLAPGAKVDTLPLITLRPRHGMSMIPTARDLTRAA